MQTLISLSDAVTVLKIYVGRYLLYSLSIIVDSIWDNYYDIEFLFQLSIGVNCESNLVIHIITIFKLYNIYNM